MTETTSFDISDIGHWDYVEGSSQIPPPPLF